MLLKLYKTNTVMQLETQLSTTKTQIDTVERIEYDNGRLLVYFKKSIKIGDEQTEAVFDSTNPVNIIISDSIQTALNVIFTEAFQKRTEKIAGINSVVFLVPDYKQFYGDLLTTNIFAVARAEANKNLQAAAAYNDFGFAITQAIVGNENPVALQICLNTMIEVLKGFLQVEDLIELNNLLTKNRIPVTPVELPELNLTGEEMP